MLRSHGSGALAMEEEATGAAVADQLAQTAQNRSDDGKPLRQDFGLY